MEMWRVTDWRCGGLLVGDVEGYWLEIWWVTGWSWRYGGLLVGDEAGSCLEMWRVTGWICGDVDVLAPWSMWWLIGRCDGSLVSSIPSFVSDGINTVFQSRTDRARKRTFCSLRFPCPLSSLNTHVRTDKARARQMSIIYTQ